MKSKEFTGQVSNNIKNRKFYRKEIMSFPQTSLINYPT